MSFLNITSPWEHKDIHYNVPNRKYNWFIDARNMIPLDYYYIYIILSLLFIPLINFGVKYMKYKRPFSLKGLLFLWNISVSILSGIGAYYTVPYLINGFNTWEEEEIYCSHQKVYTSDIAWYIGVFNATKIFEWIDTIFLILRKKKIIFLHWFHHLITFLYCWHATYFSYRSDTSGLWFSSMNLFVHAIMYGYYALTTLGLKFKFNFVITFLQTLQMIIGITITFFTLKCPDINNNYHGVFFALSMYFIYCILFLKILISKVIKIYHP